MIGIVVVSHSRRLAEAAVALAGQMAGAGGGPRVRIAAGTPDGGFGTDATAVAEAVEEVAGADGVLVLTDLGSAVMSAELALELAVPGCPVRLSPAPLVEGLVAAVARAAAGADLDTVAAEAEGALAAKQGALAPTQPPPTPPLLPATRLVLPNSAGLHARPAALLAAALGALDAEVTVGHDGRTADARSPVELMALGAGRHAVIEVRAEGPDAEAALALVAREVEAGFGER